MDRFAHWVVTHRWWVIAGWLLLSVAGGLTAPRAVSGLSYDFGLPGQQGYQTNQRIAAQFQGTGGENAPVLLVAHGHGATPASAARVRDVVGHASPGARIATWADQPRLRSSDGRTAVALVYPRAVPGPEPYAQALPAIERATSRARLPVTVTGTDAVAAQQGGGGGAGVLAETLFGAAAALVVLVLVFGSFLALTPLCVAAGSILTTFLILWGLTQVTEVSFISQYLLALIGLGVGIDYALLIVTRWREERGAGVDAQQATQRAVATAGRSVLFSGVTVAISLAALIVLPVPFLRSVGFTGLLIPLLAVAAALTLLPALLVVAGDRLAWPHRRRSSADSRLWAGIGGWVVQHRWLSIAAGVAVLGLLATPLTGLRLGAVTNTSLASGHGTAAQAIRELETSRIGSGLTQPVEVLTTRPDSLTSQLSSIDGVAGVTSPPTWRAHGRAVVDVWTSDDPSSTAGADAVSRIRAVTDHSGADAGGVPVQNVDFVDAVYGNAPWVVLLIALVTFVLLGFALRSVVLPLKALALNVLSLGAAYGLTVLIWQHGLGTQLLFDQAPAGAITVWVPIAVFAFLFGLSMDYEVFLLSRIKEEHDAGHNTPHATIAGVSRTGRLVSSGALILFLAFISLSQVPETEVKIMATGLALGIIIDATLVRGILAPALVVALGPANWWIPRRGR